MRRLQMLRSQVRHTQQGNHHNDDHHRQRQRNCQAATVFRAEEVDDADDIIDRKQTQRKKNRNPETIHQTGQNISAHRIGS